MTAKLRYLSDNAKVFSIKFGEFRNNAYLCQRKPCYFKFTTMTRRPRLNSAIGIFTSALWTSSPVRFSRKISQPCPTKSLLILKTKKIYKFNHKILYYKGYYVNRLLRKIITVKVAFLLVQTKNNHYLCSEIRK